MINIKIDHASSGYRVNFTAERVFLNRNEIVEFIRQCEETFFDQVTISGEAQKDIRLRLYAEDK